MEKKLSFLWDYDIDETRFRRILGGSETWGRLDRNWAARRLLEYATYPEITRLLGLKTLVNEWPRWRPGIRSENRRRAFDFLAAWIPQNHAEWLI